MSINEIESLAAGLPGYFPKSPDTNNYKTLVAVGNSAESSVLDIDDVADATTVQNADSIEELNELAKAVSLNHRENESIETFRTRVIARYQALTSEGTGNDLLKNASTILNVPVEQIKFSDSPEPGLVIMTFPLAAINELSISVTDFVTALEQQLAAGYRLNSQSRGTLSYISESEFTGATYDSTKGYDGLTGGVPDGQGGTYSGLLQ